MIKDRYTIISADTHAGGSHAQYREYLDPQFHEEFDAWRGQYKNPFRDLRASDDRVRNWDSERRWGDQERDGVVGEVIFPNTIPPFFPSFVLFAPQPANAEEYRLRRAGVVAHNRWLVDFVEECPERRAGIGQVFVNDIDDAIADATWIKEHGLRGGVLLPMFGPDVTWLPAYFEDSYDPLWAALQDLDVPINLHGGAGTPLHGDPFGVGGMIRMVETTYFSQRPLLHLLLGGVFERFPRLKVVITEIGCDWVPDFLRRLDSTVKALQDGMQIELRFKEGTIPSALPSEHFAQNCWIAASQPRVSDAEAGRLLPPGRFMWGNDYPHDEGTFPFTRETLRAVFEGYAEEELRAVLAGNAAAIYDFDLDALDPYVERFGPLVREIEEPLTTMPEGANSALKRAKVSH